MQADTIRINELQEIWQLKVDVLEKDKKTHNDCFNSCRCDDVFVST